jgi:hypothetical protein
MGQSRVSYHMRKLKAQRGRARARGAAGKMELLLPRPRSRPRPPGRNREAPVGVGTVYDVLMVGVEGILRSGLSDDFAEQLKAGGGGVEGR